MRSAQISKHKATLEMVTVTLPSITPGTILVEIHCCGVCHTDLHCIDGDWPVDSIIPLCPGHEGVGIVIEKAEDVTHIQRGDRVGIPWLAETCGSCEYCVSGHETVCQQQRQRGFSVQGCYSEYCLAKASHCVILPDELTFEKAAPLLCAGVTTYKGLKVSGCRPGQYCTIIGAAGGLGHLAVQYAKAMGFQVIAIDCGEAKIEYCKKLGANFALDAVNKNIVSEIERLTKGGSHGVLCLAPHQSAFNLAINITRPLGTVVCIALPAGDFQTPIFQIVLKEITIKGSIVGTRQDLSEALDFAARGLVTCSTHPESFDNVAEVTQNLREGKYEGRAVLLMK